MSATTWLGIISIIAVIVGPLIALGLQRYAENRREKRQARLHVFRTLMARRATPIHHEYVQALNLIDVVFNSKSKKETQVRTDWKILLDHLDKNKTKPDFGDNRVELSSKLLADMGNCLGFNFDPVYLKRAAYSPQGHGDVEAEQTLQRKLVLEVLRGDRRIPMAFFPDDFAKLVMPPGVELPQIEKSMPTKSASSVE
jgi:hypothetical protein